MASRKKVRRQSSLDNLLSLFRRKPKQKAGKPERPRSGSLDVPARKPSVEPGVPARKPSVEPDVPVVKIERHYSDITPRPKLTIPLRNARAAQFTTKLSNQRDHNIRLRSLDKASMSGFLEHKQVTRWALLWAVVRDHTLYGFKSQDPDEEQILLINLEDCSLVPSSKTIFRLCQFNAHSLYFRVKDGAQKWISALETITNSRDSRVTSPKINSLVLASTQPRSPSRSPNGMVKTLNLHASPRDPRRAVTKEADEGITFTARNYDADKVDITEKFTRRESHHDVTLQEVWRSSNDVIGPDKGEEDDAGGIIIHKEPVSPDSQQLLDVRRRSLSAGSLPLPLVEHLRQSCHDRLLPRRRRPRCPVEVAASQIDPKSKVGWLLVEDEALWKSSWCILSDRILFFFENPDSPKAFDCFNLLGWSLTSRLQGHSLALHHQDFHAVNMKAQQQSDLEQWEAQLRTATHRVTIEGLNLERGNSAEFDDDRDRLDAATVASQREWQQEFVQLKKQKLLQEVLQQKSRIERQQRQLQGSPTSVPEIQVSPLSGSDQELRYHGDKHIVDLVRLRQRKVSTQLKVDGIQRALHGRPNHKKKPKKRGFLSMLSGDGGSSDESLNEFNVTNDDKQGLQLQLRDLHRQLEDINNTIMIKQSERLQLGDDKLKSRSTSNLARFSRDSSGDVACSSEDSFERTSSSESMHKLMKAQQVKKMAISELIDFRQKLKIADAPPNLRHSWSPSAFENFKISKGERKLDRQSPMTCSQEFTPPPPPPRRSMGGKHKSLTSLSPRFPSPEVESNRNKLQISEDAMAKIAAFEELLQENMVM